MQNGEIDFARGYTAFMHGNFSRLPQDKWRENQDGDDNKPQILDAVSLDNLRPGNRSKRHAERPPRQKNSHR